MDGRKHIDIQTDAYLEELTDTVPEVDNNTQTDAFLDRPPTPLFVPQKTGLDATTQIENGEGRRGLHGRHTMQLHGKGDTATSLATGSAHILHLRRPLYVYAHAPVS